VIVIPTLLMGDNLPKDQSDDDANSWDSDVEEQPEQDVIEFEK
jgi:hypothetical protein